MTLTQFLNKYSDNKFQICTNKGSGFLYSGVLNEEFNNICIGYHDELQFELDRQTAKFNLMNKYDENYHVTKKSIMKLISYLDQFVDFRDREVLSASRSIIDPSYVNVIIPGRESGNYEGLNLPRITSPEDLNIDGCLRLLERVYSEAAADFQDAYKAYLRNPGDPRYKSAVQATSTFFKRSPLVSWSGVNGEEVLRTLKHRVMQNSTPVIKKTNLQQSICERMKERGLRQIDLSRKLSIRPSSISKWCRGMFPSKPVESLTKVCRFLGCEDQMKLFYANAAVNNKKVKR